MTERSLRYVGPVLEAGAVGWAVARAIRAENDGAETVDRGSYLRVRARGRCHVSRVAIEAELGAPFRLPGDLEKVMPSFAGRFAVDDDGASWEEGG
jgi:hypothetical protein